MVRWTKARASQYSFAEQQTTALAVTMASTVIRWFWIMALEECIQHYSLKGVN